MAGLLCLLKAQIQTQDSPLPVAGLQPGRWRVYDNSQPVLQSNKQFIIPPTPLLIFGRQNLPGRWAGQPVTYFLFFNGLYIARIFL